MPYLAFRSPANILAKMLSLCIEAAPVLPCTLAGRLWLLISKNKGSK